MIKLVIMIKLVLANGSAEMVHLGHSHAHESPCKLIASDSPLLIPQYLACVQRSQVSHITPCWLASMGLANTVHGYLTGPGFMATSPASSSNQKQYELGQEGAVEHCCQCRAYTTAYLPVPHSNNWQGANSTAPGPFQSVSSSLEALKTFAIATQANTNTTTGDAVSTWDHLNITLPHSIQNKNSHCHLACRARLISREILIDWHFALGWFMPTLTHNTSKTVCCIYLHCKNTWVTLTTCRLSQLHPVWPRNATNRFS